MGNGALLVDAKLIKHDEDGYFMDGFPLPWVGATIAEAHTANRYIVTRVSLHYAWLEKIDA